MKIEYYVTARPRTDDFYAIHKGDCPFLNSDEEKIFLGSFNSGSEAESEGQKYFKNSRSCAFCSKNESADVTRPPAILSFERMLVFEDPISGSFSQDLFCCVN